MLSKGWDWSGEGSKLREMQSRPPEHEMSTLLDSPPGTRAWASSKAWDTRRAGWPWLCGWGSGRLEESLELLFGSAHALLRHREKMGQKERVWRMNPLPFQAREPAGERGAGPSPHHSPIPLSGH